MTEREVFLERLRALIFNTARGPTDNLTYIEVIGCLDIVKHEMLMEGQNENGNSEEPDISTGGFEPPAEAEPS